MSVGWALSVDRVLEMRDLCRALGRGKSVMPTQRLIAVSLELIAVWVASYLAVWTAFQLFVELVHRALKRLDSQVPGSDKYKDKRLSVKFNLVSHLLSAETRPDYIKMMDDARVLRNYYCRQGNLKRLFPKGAVRAMTLRYLNTYLNYRSRQTNSVI